MVLEHRERLVEYSTLLLNLTLCVSHCVSLFLHHKTTSVSLFLWAKVLFGESEASC